MASTWAAAVAQQARFELNAPIQVVSGPETISAALALELPEKPRVLLEGNPAISPWVPAQAPSDCSGIHIGWGEPPVGGHELKGGPPGLYWQVTPAQRPEACPLGPQSFQRTYRQRMAKLR